MEMLMPSLSAMSFGPESMASEANSFVVLERETADGVQQGEAVPGPGPGPSAASVSLGAPVSNHFGPAFSLNNGMRNATANGLREPQTLGSVLDGSYSMPSNVQQRMDDLIQENLHLQVTVDQTNMSLRQMMSTLSEWRLDREKVIQEHKEKFQETRTLVMNLKKEKSEMRAVIEELQKKVNEYQTREEASSFMTVEPTTSEIELKSIVGDLQSKLNIVEAAYQAEQEKNKSYEEEIKQMKEGRTMMEEQIKHFEQLQVEAENQAEELKTLREENRRFLNSIENLNSVERHSQDYQAAQASGFRGKLDEVTAKLLKSEQELQVARSEIDHLQSNDRSMVSPEEALTDALATVERLRSRIDEMTANIVELDEKCETQTQNIAALQEEKTVLLRENEAVGILRAQAEVYQADFLAERECRERLAVEKEQLAEDLRRLHRHNQELQREGNAAVAGVAAVAANTRPNPTPPPQPAEETAPNSLYRCVVCSQLTFRTLQALNEHIDRCLDNSPV